MHSHRPSSLARSSIDCSRSLSWAAAGRSAARAWSRLVLRVGVVQVRHQVLDHRQMRQRIDDDAALHVVDRFEAGERVGAVDVHGAGAADALAAGAAEGQRGVDLVLDLDQRVQNHRPAVVEIDRKAVEPRVLAALGIPAVDPEGLDALGARRSRKGLAGPDLGIGGKGEFDHTRLLSRPAPWAGKAGPRSTA